VSAWRLISDVGGSNARFARAANGMFNERRTYHTADYPTFYDAMQRYLADTGGAEDCRSAAVGVAGPVNAGKAKLTNAPWVFTERDISEALGGVPTELLNDLQTVAVALPHLTEKDLRAIGAAHRAADARTMLALNVGTGFGGATAVPVRSGWISLGCEPGHMSLGAVDAEQFRVLEGIPTVEEALSGRGVLALYRHIAARRGAPMPDGRSGADIFASAASDTIAAETAQVFSRLLGRVAGDLVLATGAWGGVYLCGSVALGWAKVGDLGAFREAFESKGPMAGLMQGIYSGVIERDDINLFGLAVLGIGA
jgi:glucokinase